MLLSLGQFGSAGTGWPNNRAPSGNVSAIASPAATIQAAIRRCGQANPNSRRLYPVFQVSHIGLMSSKPIRTLWPRLRGVHSTDSSRTNTHKVSAHARPGVSGRATGLAGMRSGAATNFSPDFFAKFLEPTAILAILLSKDHAQQTCSSRCYRRRRLRRS